MKIKEGEGIIEMIWKLAWRNIWRNKRRSILTLLTIVFGVAIILFAIAWADGVHNQMIESTIRIQTGHSKIHYKGYNENKSLNLLIEHPKKIINIITQEKKIIGFSPRLVSQGLVSSETNTIGATIIGFNPEKEVTVSKVKESIIKGSFLSQPKEIIIGDKMARNLHVDIGEELVLLTQAMDGSIGAELYTIGGIFQTGFPDMDRATVMINLEDAQELLMTGEGISEISILVKDSALTKKIAKSLKSKIDLNKYEVLTWEEILPGLVQFIRLDNAGTYAFLLILLIVVAFGVLNTILMSVMERTREFGMMKALGTKPWQIIQLILTEAFILTIIGILIGTLIGSGVSLYFATHPIVFSEYEMSFREFGFEPEMYTKLTFKSIFCSGPIVLFISMISCFYPAIRASRFKPAQALK